MRKTLGILLAVLFLVSVTATAVSAGCDKKCDWWGGYKDKCDCKKDKCDWWGGCKDKCDCKKDKCDWWGGSKDKCDCKKDKCDWWGGCKNKSSFSFFSFSFGNWGWC